MDMLDSLTFTVLAGTHSGTPTTGCVYECIEEKNKAEITHIGCHELTQTEIAQGNELDPDVSLYKSKICFCMDRDECNKATCTYDGDMGMGEERPVPPPGEGNGNGEGKGNGEGGESGVSGTSSDLLVSLTASIISILLVNN